MPLSDLYCATTAFNALPDSSLNAIKASLTTTINVANAQIVMFNTRILNLDIILAPLFIKRDAINSILETYQNQVSILSTNITYGCPALGTANEYAQSILNSVMTQAKRILAEINRTQAIKLRYQQYVDKLQTSITFLQRIQASIDNVLATRSTVITIANINPTI
jgi:hypothetical protein